MPWCIHTESVCAAILKTLSTWASASQGAETIPCEVGDQSYTSLAAASDEWTLKTRVVVSTWWVTNRLGFAQQRLWWIISNKHISKNQSVTGDLWRDKGAKLNSSRKKKKSLADPTGEDPPWWRLPELLQPAAYSLKQTGRDLISWVQHSRFLSTFVPASLQDVQTTSSPWATE